MGSLCPAQEAHLGVCDDLEGCDGGRELQGGGDTCIHIVDSLHCTAEIRGGVTILKFDFISFLYLLYLLSLHYESGLKTTLYGILLLIYYVNICLLIDTVSLHTLKYDYQCI